MKTSKNLSQLKFSMLKSVDESFKPRDTHLHVTENVPQENLDLVTKDLGKLTIVLRNTTTRISNLLLKRAWNKWTISSEILWTNTIGQKDQSDNAQTVGQRTTSEFWTIVNTAVMKQDLTKEVVSQLGMERNTEFERTTVTGNVVKNVDPTVEYCIETATEQTTNTNRENCAEFESRKKQCKTIKKEILTFWIVILLLGTL